MYVRCKINYLCTEISQNGQILQHGENTDNCSIAFLCMALNTGEQSLEILVHLHNTIELFVGRRVKKKMYLY